MKANFKNVIIKVEMMEILFVKSYIVGDGLLVIK